MSHTDDFEADPWREFHERYSLTDKNVISTSRYDRYRRVYDTGERILKVVVTDKQESSHLRNSTPESEYEVLRRCENVAFTPTAFEFRSDGIYDVIALEKIRGDQFVVEEATVWLTIRVAFFVTTYAFRLALLGISHNDLRHHNVLVVDDRYIKLIDFDQATIHTRTIAIIRSVFGKPIGGKPVHRSATGFSIRVLLGKLAAPFPRRLRNAVKAMLGMTDPDAVPEIPDDASSATKKLAEAWQIAQTSRASSPGQTLAYYTFTHEGFVFPGERDWVERWSYLREITSFKGKKVLELGCNMALLSCHLIKEEGAESALAIDIDAEILESAKLIAEVLETPVDFRNVDLDKTDIWDADLGGYHPDVVFALNVLNWVEDKQRLLDFLGRAKELVIEGHDSAEVEISKLEALGFSTIRLVRLTERDRPVIYCSKEPS